ncbi:MAG: endonuclease III, partial [Clostridia bacterium]|nr:endonuclease III [Clostridia bacterium]
MPDIAKIHEILRELYPDALCSLTWDGDPWRLLVMGMLSAQCTDERVNKVCPALFERFPTVTDMAAADPAEIAE